MENITAPELANIDSGATFANAEDYATGEFTIYSLVSVQVRAHWVEAEVVAHMSEGEIVSTNITLELDDALVVLSH